MIVDDDELFLSEMKAGLQAFGDVEVVEFDDPQEAAANICNPGLWKDGYPEIFFLDLVMPTMMGFQVAEIIRAQAPLQKVPIVYFTASGRLLTRDELKQWEGRFNKEDCLLKGDVSLEHLRMEILKRTGRLPKR